MCRTSKSAVVVGGGIGGLATAIGLARIGWQVRVLEQAPAFGAVGAGISLLANGLRALDELGVGAAVRAAGLSQPATRLSTARGRLLSSQEGAAIEARLGTSVYSFLRPELHDALRESLAPEVLVPGARVTGVKRDGVKARVRYSTSSGNAELEADLVVGADGLGSTVRSATWPGLPEPVYSGSTVWRGVTSVPVESAPGIYQAWGPGAEFGCTWIPGGRVEWHGVANAPEGVRYPDEAAEVRRRFGSWHDPIPTVLEATPPEAVLHHDIFDLMTPPPSYVRGRVVLLGDAAHAMPPHLGQGAGMALEDAVVLAAELRASPDTDSALARYNRLRRPRSIAVARNARRVGRLGPQLENRFVSAVRNTAIRLSPPGVGLREMVRTAGWTPPSLDPARKDGA